MSECVVIHLDDQSRCLKNCILLDMLETRFKLQAKGMIKYLSKMNEYLKDPKRKVLPIEFYDDRQVLLETVVGEGTFMMEFLHSSLRNDREFVLSVSKAGRLLFDWASPELLNDFEIVAEMIRFDADVIDRIPSSITKDREKVKKLVQINGKILDSLPRYDRDREIGLLSIKGGGPIPLRFFHDKEFLRAYALRNPSEARDIDPEDKELAIELVKADPNCLFHLPQNFRQDRDVVYEAVRIEGTLLSRVKNSQLRQDRELILAACNAGYSIDETSPTQFLNDREIVLSSLKSNPYLINSLSPELKQDKDVLKACLASFGRNILPIEKLPDYLRSDKDFLNELISINPRTYELLPTELKSERELAILALKQNGEMLEFVSDELKADREIVKIAISNCGYAIVHAAPSLLEDIEIGMAAIRKHGAALIHLPYLKSNKVAVLEALQNFREHYDLFSEASDELKDDRDFVKQAVKINPLFFRSVSSRLKEDPTLVLELVEEKPSILFERFFNYPFEREFLLKILRKDSRIYVTLPYHLLTDFDFIMEAVCQSGELTENTISQQQFNLLKKTRLEREYYQLFLSSTHNISLV